MTEPRTEPPSHVDALMAKYTHGRSIKEIERQHGLPEGALGNHLKPSQRGRLPRLSIQQRIADALGAPLQDVSVAFLADSGIDLGGTHSLPPDCQPLVEDYLALDPTRRQLVRTLVRAVLEQQQAEHP